MIRVLGALVGLFALAVAFELLRRPRWGRIEPMSADRFRLYQLGQRGCEPNE